MEEVGLSNISDFIESYGDSDVAQGLDSSQIIGAVAGLAGIVGNGMVCYIMLRFRSVFASVTNKLMLHQSAVDCLLSLVMFITRVYTPWGEFYCRVPRGWLYWGLANVSTANLIFISCDRYVAVCHPIKYRQWFSARRSDIGLVSVWVFPAAWQFYLVLVHVPVGQACVAIWPNDTARLVFGVATFSWEYLIPITFMGFAYTSTILALRKRVQKRAINTAANPTSDHVKPKKDPLQTAKVKLTITFIIVAILFVICWGPTEITWLLFNFNVIQGSYYSTLWHLGLETPLLCLNTCVNPIIYCFTYDRFRRHVKKTLCGCLKSNQVGDEVTRENVTEISTEAPMRSGPISAAIHAVT